MKQNILVAAGREVAPILMATTAKARSKGLLGRSSLDGAIWLAPARQVHTFRMKFAIDVAHVDRNGVITHVATMPPGKLGRWSWTTRGVIEAEAGAFERWGLAPGVKVDFTNPERDVVEL